MARKNRGHRPPKQSRQQVPPGQLPNEDQAKSQAEKQAKAQAEYQIRIKVESIAAQIFTDAATAIVKDASLEDFDSLAGNSVDAALAFGRELWGIQAKRVKPPQKPKRRPRVLTEDDPTEPCPEDESDE